MRTLNENQKNFLLNNFFVNEKYPGWKNIATKLLENGRCIVAGKGCIWMGGIGNFIRTEEAKDAVDCTEYKFYLDSFLSSEWFKEIANDHISILENNKKELEKEILDINNICG